MIGIKGLYDFAAAVQVPDALKNNCRQCFPKYFKINVSLV